MTIIIGIFCGDKLYACWWCDIKMLKLDNGGDGVQTKPKYGSIDFFLSF